ncbi:MAG: DUF4426 domain-containing protein [Spongiibacteraceae bacterium]
MFKKILLIISFTLFAINSNADNEKAFGDYDVHYTVLNSSFISPETAKAYGIVRGKDRALINIVVRQRLDKGESKPKKAIVTGSSSDLIHSAKLDFQEIIEQQAVYYIAELKFNHKELRTFTIKVQPDPNIAPYTLKFSKTLYVDQK